MQGEQPTAQPTLPDQAARVHPVRRAGRRPSSARRQRCGRARRRPHDALTDLNDAQHAAMTLHSTTFCAIHKCSTLHTARTRHARHARSMSTRPGQPTRGMRATRAAARASMPRSPRQTRSRSRHRATRSRTKFCVLVVTRAVLAPPRDPTTTYICMPIHGACPARRPATSGMRTAL